MKRIGNIFEELTTFDNLLLASKKAMRRKRNKKPISEFYFNLENEIFEIQNELIQKTYRPGPYIQFEIREHKRRLICSSNFRDRVVHHSICNYCDPVFEKRFIFDSYACRPGKGAHSAVRRCQKFSRKFRYFLKCDIKKFFHSINHDILKELLRKNFKDEDFLNLLDLIIDNKVPGNLDRMGLPIGILTSQNFANFYLDYLDHFVKEHIRIPSYLRYMDDFISFSNDKYELNKYHQKIEGFLAETLNLSLKERVTKLAPVSEGIPFLGFNIYPSIVRIKRENLVRMRNKIRRKEEEYIKGIISERSLVQSVNSVIGHVAHVNSKEVRKDIFTSSLKMA